MVPRIFTALRTEIFPAFHSEKTSAKLSGRFTCVKERYIEDNDSRSFFFGNDAPLFKNFSIISAESIDAFHEYIHGKMNTVYLFGAKADRSYFILILFLIFIGTLTGSELMWEINDLSNGFMVIPNVLALFVLTDMVKNASAGLKK